MAAHAAKGQKPLARDVARYNDAELEEFLQESKNRHGMYVIDVSDPENLPQDFINRLRDRATVPTHYQAIDLDQVTARLLAASTETDTAQRDRSPTAPLSPAGSSERRHYEALVRAGGRPCYPIQKLDDVMNDPHAYREILRPWVYHEDMNPPEWEVFRRQLSNWEGFRDWQKANRDVGWRSSRRAVRRALAHFNRHRKPGFLSYAEAVQGEVMGTRGMEMGRSYFPFELRPDTEEQDQLSTWTEYLVYAKNLYTHCFAFLDSQTIDLNTAWNTLEKSVKLQPFETRHYVRSKDAKLQQAAAVRDAAAALETAKLDLSRLVPPDFDPSDLEASRLRVPPQKRRLLAAAVKRVKETQTALDLAKERDRHFVEFYLEIRQYESTLDEVERLLRQLEWAEKQYALVKAEQDQSRPANHDPVVERSTKRRSIHDRGEDGAAAQQRTPGPKKQRLQPPKSAARFEPQQSDAHPKGRIPASDISAPNKHGAAVRAPPPSVPKWTLRRNSQRSNAALVIEPEPVGGRRSRRLAGMKAEYGPLS
ncbi:hypothetical protein PG993_006910 [Apiospora rasikravindrae]|uniref:Uncharacterized protein n=1 Tax=Apiospora rasikravindrae TaxID=990691 RepID=A0ABR1SVY8_9PEZI